MQTIREALPETQVYQDSMDEDLLSDAGLFQHETDEHKIDRVLDLLESMRPERI